MDEKIKNVIIFSNGQVMSFDKNDEQVLECQGFILDMCEKLKKNCDENTKWSFGKINEGKIESDFSWYWIKDKV